MIPEAPENKMLVPAEVKAGRPAEPAKGSFMCPSCGASLLANAVTRAQTCPQCRMRVRLGLVP